MLKNFILCAAAVVILAGIILAVLLIVRAVKKSSSGRSGADPAACRENPAQSAVDARPFAVEEEITYIHSQERLDAEDF